MKKWTTTVLAASLALSGFGAQPAFASSEKVDFETAKEKLEGHYNVKREGYSSFTSVGREGYDDIIPLITDYVPDPQVKTNLVVQKDGLVYERSEETGKCILFNGTLEEVTAGIFTVKEGYVKLIRRADYAAFINGADQLIKTSTSLKEPVVLITNSLGVGPESYKINIKKGKIETKRKKRIFADKDTGVKYVLKNGYVVADTKRFTGKLTLRPHNNSSETYVKQTLTVKKGLVQGLKTKTYDKESYKEALAKLSE